MKFPTKKYDLGLKDFVTFRPFTADEDIIRAVLIDRTEYGFFVGCNPKVIFDIGANIGATSVLLANAYPNAVIYAFEPEPENYMLLLENTKAYPNVKAFNIGLGGTTEKRMLAASEDELNLGGFSFHGKGVDSSKTQEVQVVDIKDFIANEDNLKIDLLKIDTEGSEYEILKALSEIQKIPPYIMGEGHGTNDWKMLDLLDGTHDIKITKELSARVFPFYALRKPIDVTPS